MTAHIIQFDPLMQGMPDDEETLKETVAQLTKLVADLEAPFLRAARIKNYQATVRDLRKQIRGLNMGLGVNSIEHEAVTTMGGTRK